MDMIKFTYSQLRKIAYAIDCRFGFGDELAEKVYDYLEEKTGVDYRL